VSSPPTKNTTKTIRLPLSSATVPQHTQLQTIQGTNLDLIAPKSHLRNRAGLLAKDPGTPHLLEKAIDFTGLFASFFTPLTGI
jgi:hypothetical protein